MYFTLGMQDVPSSNTSIENNPEIKPGGPWSFWPTVGFGLLVILAYFVGQIAIEAIFAVNSLISHRGESITQLTNVLSNGTALTTTIFVSTIIGVGFTLQSNGNVVASLKIKSSNILCRLSYRFNNIIFFSDRAIC